MKHLSFVLFISFFSQMSLAASPCSEYLVRHGAFKFQRFESDDHKTCYSGADPFDVLPAMIYRSYLVTNSGVFMVFNSYNSSNAPSATGARVFHFFPRNQTPEIQVSGTNQVTYKFATQGLELILSQKKAQVLGMKGGKVKEASKVSPSNQGGIEFSGVKTLYLDSGFTLGQDSTAIPDHFSKFIDVKANECVVRNDEVFSLVGTGDVIFKFSDSELKDFLKDRCPNIFVNF